MSSSRFFLLCAVLALPVASGSGSISAAAHEPEPPAARTDAPADTSADAARPLPFLYDLYTFRGRGGTTAVVSAFAVEAGHLDTEDAGRSARYRFSVTLVLVDTVLRSVSDTHDTVFVDVARPLPDEHVLYTHVQVPARPSPDIRHRVIMTDATRPGVGQLYSQHFVIPDYGGDQLMISDIAFGSPGMHAGWRRGDLTLALLPTDRFPSTPFDVYYEVYNLPAGHSYTTEIAIAEVHEGRPTERDPVRLRFSGESAAGPDDMLPELRRVESALPPGSYHLTVTITDLATRRSASRSRPLEVRRWDRGATMVAAHPREGRRIVR